MKTDYGEVLENGWRLFWEQDANVDYYASEKPMYLYREVLFDRKRRWRLDCMFTGTRFIVRENAKSVRMPDKTFEKHPVAVELHGATWTNGRHTRGQGFQNDRLKMNAALQAGIVVLEYTADMLSNDPFGVIEQILAVYREFNG